jgi:hypothetical protein
MQLITEEIPKDLWRTYLDALSKRLGTVEAMVEVAGRDLGAQIEAERLVLTGITYDDKDDVLLIALDTPAEHDNLERLIERPQQIFVAEGGPSMEMVIDIEDAERHRTIVRLERPPALPGD